MDGLVDSDGPSDGELHISSSCSDRSSDAGSDLPREATLHNDCAVGHRVQASRSVLALALDEECVFAGLQGGDIVVRSHWKFSSSQERKKNDTDDSVPRLGH